MTLTAHEVNELKKAPAHDRILPVVLHRWSPRSFADRDVNPADLKTIFEAVRWTPSSFNEQPWRYFVGIRGSETYQKILQSLGEFNQAWARSAPVLILNATKATFSHNDSPNVVAVYDLGASAATLVYQAWALGLFTHQMAGYDREVARKLLNVPDGYTFGAAMALGYQGEPSALGHERFIAQEVAPRQRKALSEFVLADWGVPADLG
ncbi:MAG TPA: nitroreductase family protein [Bryobacteraceae bacterium]|nr:nitroreductase family protein [Bryobacteraceae bacterium]